MKARLQHQPSPHQTAPPATPRAPATLQVVLPVRSPDDVVLATEVHVQRLGLLSSELLTHVNARAAAAGEQSPCHLVEADILAEFTKTHDLGKISSHPLFLAAHGLQQPLSHELFEQWGKPLTVTADQPNGLVEQLHRISAAIEENFFYIWGISDPAARAQYRLLVEVADRVDSRRSPLSYFEEMGKTASPVGEYLKGSPRPVDEFIAHLAAHLEANYDALIPPTMNYFDARETCDRKARRG